MTDSHGEATTGLSARGIAILRHPGVIATACIVWVGVQLWSGWWLSLFPYNLLSVGGWLLFCLGLSALVGRHRPVAAVVLYPVWIVVLLLLWGPYSELRARIHLWRHMDEFSAHLHELRAGEPVMLSDRATAKRPMEGGPVFFEYVSFARPCGFAYDPSRPRDGGWQRVGHDRWRHLSDGWFEYTD